MNGKPGGLLRRRLPFITHHSSLIITPGCRMDHAPTLDPAAAAAPSPGVASGGVRGVLRNRTFRSLQFRDYRLYFTGQIVSLTGSWMQSAALMWLTYEQTRDPLWPPLMLVAQVGPTLVLGTWGGALADRFPRRRLILCTQMAYLVNAAVLTALVASNFAGPWLLFAVQVANGVIQSVDLPARLAYVPSLVPRAALANAVALNSMIFNAARAVGPAAAGGLFWLAEYVVGTGLLPHSPPVTLGAVWCFTLNGLSFLVVIAALQRISVDGAPARAGGADARPGGEVWAGFRAVRADRRLLLLLAAAGGVSLFAWPALTLFPTYTDKALGHAEKEYAVLVSALGAGALASAFLTATFGSEARRGLFLTVGAAAAAGGLLALSLAGGIVPAAAGAGLLGAGLILHLSTGQSALQLSVADDKRGRVMALWPMMLSASSLVGQLVAGAAAQRLDVRHVMAGMAAGAAVTAAVVGWRAGRPTPTP